MFQGYSSQERSQPEVLPSVLKGCELEEHLVWEKIFRETLSEQGFSLLNLPTLLPSSRFQSELTGEGMLSSAPSFRDSKGRDWLLRSDMTAFSTQVIRGEFALDSGSIRVGYYGKVFTLAPRQDTHAVPGNAHGLNDGGMESFEYGAEIVAPHGAPYEHEALRLALLLAERFGYENLVLVMGHSQFWVRAFELVEQSGIWSSMSRTRMMSVLKAAFLRRDGALLSSVVGLEKLITAELERNGLYSLREELSWQFPRLRLLVDPFQVRSSDFYSGLTFEIYASAPSALERNEVQLVGAGGRYDRYLKHFGMDASAVGFKLLDPGTHNRRVLAGAKPAANTSTSDAIGLRRVVRIAVPKGRLLARVFEAFAALNLVPEQDPNTTRRLVIPSFCGQVVFLLVKNTDVSSYVEGGGADFGICGSDILDENSCNLVRPLTFTFGKTRLCLAGLRGQQDAFFKSGQRTVASKYHHTAKRLLEEVGCEARVIPLQGSVELASVLGIAQAVVDLVETGRTLEDNGLEVYRELSATRVHFVTSSALWLAERERISEWYDTWHRLGVVEDSNVLFENWVENGVLP